MAINYISTRNHAPAATLAQAVLQGRPDDGGLYMPSELPRMPRAFFSNWQQLSFAEMAYVLADMLFGHVLGSPTVKAIVDKAFNYPVPLININDRLWAVELFHGPTLAFKDFGARFGALMLPHLAGVNDVGRKLNVLIATTGNTGAAMADALSGKSDVDAYILFPRASCPRDVQSQFTTLGGNIHALEVQGSIDDCHAMVSQALADDELRTQMRITSGNSDSIIRLMPQVFYYFYAMARICAQTGRSPEEIAIGIPAGNLGNLTACLMAKKMGLPTGEIVACENTNSYLCDMLARGMRTPRHTVPTLAAAADKGEPSNIERLLWLYDNDMERLRQAVTAISCADVNIIPGVNELYERHNYTCDPNTALAYHGLKQRTAQTGQTGLMLSVAHPAKSLAAMTAITGRAMDLPLQMYKYLNKPDYRKKIPPYYNALRNAIAQNN